MLFVNVTIASGIKRKDCSVIINVENQIDNFHWNAAGEASTWNQLGINDFCNFVINMYNNYIQILLLKSKKDIVSDMSLLWLWWVCHYRNEKNKFKFGSPFPLHPDYKMNTFPAAFNYAKNLILPKNISKNILLCNGMDIIERTAYDHRHGFKIHINGYGIDNNKIPFITGISLPNGGKPENLSHHFLMQIYRTRIYLNNFHYQGVTKYTRLLLLLQ